MLRNSNEIGAEKRETETKTETETENRSQRRGTMMIHSVLTAHV